MMSAMTKFLRDKLKHCAKGDVLIGISTSGESVMLKTEAANKNNAFTLV